MSSYIEYSFLSETFYCSCDYRRTQLHEEEDFYSLKNVHPHELQRICQIL